MRKILLFFIPLLFSVCISNAQLSSTDNNEALQLVSANKATLGLSAEDLSNVMVSSTYQDNVSGVRMVYLQQTYKGIPVYNQMLVLAFKNNRLVSNAGVFNHSMEKLANVKTGIPSVTAAGAVQSALSDRKLSPTQMAIGVPNGNNKTEFGTMGVTQQNITAQLMWVPVETTMNKVTSVTKMVLGWQVFVMPKTTSDAWLVKVDASDNSILGMDNLTVSDNWGRPMTSEEGVINYPEFTKNAINNTDANSLFDFKTINELTEATGPTTITTATYRVLPIPLEAPSFGAVATRTDPWLAAPGNATTLKWNTGAGGTDYAYTRGNNVWAYQDQGNANNGSLATSASSTTAVPNLTFDFVPNFTVAPTQTTPVQNQQFYITNLFYWNNIYHDILYQYGFTEAAGNFQDDNLGRGGVGNDHVNGEAQDGSGTNNANFFTPADGTSGRMQMYLFTTASPQLDGDVDAGVVTHEHSHGLSNRLTGGAATGTCLGNAEQMGEGWSDYYCLMLTQNWATATLNTGFNSPRGIGTYVLNQPTTALGIRSQKYCTDFSINNKVYAASIPAEPHDRGEIWCAVLWDMTWNIINQAGTINSDLYNGTATGGNTIAFKLVTQGLKLQQCSPGFISGRNAILAADQLLYGGQYDCAIWEAFRRRGMGAFASEGSTNSVTDQIADFTPPVTLSLTQGGITSVSETQNINYVNTVATCSPITNYLVTDTLPTNVTYVSGGTYNAANRVVSFTATQAAGSTNYPFTVNVNAGSYFVPVTLLNEPVAGATIPATWTTTATPGNPWTVVSTQSSSAPNAFFAQDLTIASDEILAMTNTIALPVNSYPKLTFKHLYNTEDGWDGGVVEISTNGGTTWTDLGPNMVSGGYNGGLGAGVGNNLAGRAAFTGQTAGFPTFRTTVVSLAQYAGQSIKIRFRMASDDNTAAPTSPTGWWVDDIVVDAGPAVNMRTSLFNASSVRVSYKDTVTLITPLILCSPNIIQQPVSTTVCATSPASFTCVATATGGVTYQWQVSTNGGGSWSDIPGATASTYTFTAALAQNGNLFRCVVTGTCNPTATSTAATLTVVSATIGGTINPATILACGQPNNGTMTLSGHNGVIVRWEFSTNGGGSWTNIANTSATQTFNNVTTNTQYRALVQVAGCAAVYSSIANVVFTAALPLTIISDVPTTLCQGDPALLTVVGLTVNTFSNPTPILVPGTGTSGNAAPYPSSITVTGVPTTGAIVKNVVLNNISHTWEADMSFVLQSPTGQNVILMSAVPGNFGIANATYTFDDAAPAGLGTASPSGTYKPTNNSTTRNWPAPGPGTVVQGVNPLLSSFTGDPNGVWNLYAIDAAAGDVGTVSGGFSITFNAISTVPGLTYTWTPTTGLNQSTGNPVAASPATTTTYTVFADNGAGCVRQASITLNVNTRPTITSQPANLKLCSGLPATFTVGATATGITYQWQESTNGGTSYTSLINAAPYSGVNTATLTISPTTGAMNNNRYRCVIGGTCPPAANSNGAILTITALPIVPINPPGPVCGGVAGISGTMLTAGSSVPPVPGSVTINSGAINLAVPDNSAAGVNNVLNVAGIPANATIVNVSVKLNMSHTYPGDMIFNLKGPSGQILNLYKYGGGAGTGASSGVPTWGWYNASVSTAGTAAFSSVTVAPFIYGATPIWKADAINGPVAGVTIQNPTGFVSNAATFTDLYTTPTTMNAPWTLAMADGGAGDVGTLASWSIVIDYTTPGGTGSPLTYTWAPSAGLYIDPNAVSPYITGTQTGVVYAAPTVFTTYTVSGTDATTGCVGTTSVLVNYTPPAPTITPAAVLMCLGDPAVKLKSSSAQTFTSSFTSGAVNVNIPDGPGIPPVPTSYPATTSTIAVAGIPATATVANIRAKFNITHAYVGDLVMVLKAPNGNVFNLDAMLNKTNGPGANFTNTVISSSGSTLLSAGTAPFTATFAPDAAGATFAAFGFTFPGGPAGYIPNVASFSGLYSVPNGTWTLAVYDAGAPDGGTINNWSLDIDYVVGVPATPAVWTPAAGLFSDAIAATPYVAGTAVDSVWARPTPSGVYPYQATVQSLPPAPVTATLTNTATTFFTTLTFNVRNNNNYAVKLTNISSMCNLTGATDVAAYYKASAVNGLPGAITTANGWNQFGSGTINSIGFPNVQPFLSNLNLVIPANSTYGILVSALLGATPNLVFSNAGTNLIASGGGCDIITGPNIGYTGPAVPGAPTFTPYFFIGSIGVVPNLTACQSPGKTVIVTVNQPLAIATQPTDVAVCTDKVASFTAAVTGTSPTHNWQVSINNGNTWTNVVNGGIYAGANTGTLTISGPPVSMSGYLYRDSVSTTACAPAFSNRVKLTVNPLPTIVIAASPYKKLFPGLTTTLFSTVTPAASTYTWLRNGIAVPGAAASSLLVGADGLGDYTLRVTDVNGCTNLSNLVSLTDSANGRVFIYPTPNGGQFQVRYYSIINNANLPRGINVYDATGKRVLVQTYTINAPYARMDVDLRKHGTGVYWVEVVDASGNRLAVGRTEVLR